MAGFAAPKILWLSRHEPQTHQQIAYILLPKDYVGFRPYGLLLTDPSDAAGTSWSDEKTRSWSDRLCEVTATDADWLPDVRDGTEIVGKLSRVTAVRLGLPHGIPVVTGAGATAACAIGIGATKT